MFFPVTEIIDELKQYLSQINPDDYDVITVVGDGEPSLYLGLHDLVIQIKKLQSKPVAIISNGGLLSDGDVYHSFLDFDIVLLNFDAWDEESHKKINRPIKSIKFDEKMESYRKFSHEFTGILYFEMMMIPSINDSIESIEKISELLSQMKYTKAFVNAPVRPPAEHWVKVPTDEQIKYAEGKFKATSIAFLPESDFDSPLSDCYEGILNIIARHPMNTNDISNFLEKKLKEKFTDQVFQELLKKFEEDQRIQIFYYQGINFYRWK
jgi:wyosine [tRNA(Phe)-imidazoG37] synthetase (radical SAM superfamily)